MLRPEGPRATSWLAGQAASLCSLGWVRTRRRRTYRACLQEHGCASSSAPCMQAPSSCTSSSSSCPSCSTHPSATPCSTSRPTCRRGQGRAGCGSSQQQQGGGGSGAILAARPLGPAGCRRSPPAWPSLLILSALLLVWLNLVQAAQGLGATALVILDIFKGGRGPSHCTHDGYSALMHRAAHLCHASWEGRGVLLQAAAACMRVLLLSCPPAFRPRPSAQAL